jgi:hypothetical protein
VNLNVWRLFREHKIEIPFPQRDIHLYTGDGAPLRVETIAVKPPAETVLQNNENEAQTPSTAEKADAPADAKKGPQI